MSHPQAECAFMAQDISAGRSSKNGAPWKQTDGWTNEPAAAQAPVSIRRQHTAEPCKDEADLAPSCVLVFFIFMNTRTCRRAIDTVLVMRSWYRI